MASSNLTQSRALSSGFSASSLNSVFVEVATALVATLPQSVTDNGGVLANVGLAESDAIATGIETIEDILEALTYYGNTLQGTVDSTTGDADVGGNGLWELGVIYEKLPSTDAEENFPTVVIDVFDYIDNANITQRGRFKGHLNDYEQAKNWKNTIDRLTDIAKDQAMFFGNSLVSEGKMYNTARVGTNIDVNSALNNANRYAESLNASNLSTIQNQSLAVPTKLLPVANNGYQYAMNSGGGNPQQVSWAQGNSSPFSRLKGFQPISANSTVVSNRFVGSLSTIGSQQTFETNFNTVNSKANPLSDLDPTVPVVSLYNGVNARSRIGRIGFKLAGLSAATTGVVSIQDYTPSDTSIGGYSGDLLSTEPFSSADWTFTVGLTLAIEDYQEFDYNGSNAVWGLYEKLWKRYSLESFTSGFSEGARSPLDRPLSCGDSSSGSGEDFIDLTSQIDGTNTTFSVGELYTSKSLRVFLNGQRLRINSEYVENSDRSTFSTTFTPTVGDVIFIDYTAFR